MLALALIGSESAAQSGSFAEKTKVVVIDVGALPEGEIPSLPAESDAPNGVPAWTEPAAITVTPAGETARPRRRKPLPQVSKKSSLLPPRTPRTPRTEKVKLVSIAPATPTLDALYPPASDATDLEAQAAQKLSCGERESILPIRWESLVTTPSGDARLAVHDLWFDAKSCAVGPGPEATIALKAIAWEDGKPWLYAMRGRAGVTLVMPRVSDISSESMAGAPVSMRGDFTRITMPLGRWGSASIVAELDSLGAPDSGDGVDRSVEVGIELVQTMSENAPTLLVRTRRADARPADDARE